MDTPGTDQNWQDAYVYLASRLNATETVLSPDGLKQFFKHQGFEESVFQNYFSSTYLKAEDFDWIVIHKGMLKTINSAFLDQVDTTFRPVFSNAVFVIFSNRRNWLQRFRKPSEHLQAYYDLRDSLKSLQSEVENPSTDEDKQHIILDPACLRNADALLCSYPKCGRTWLRFMLASYMHLLSQSSEAMDFQRMDALVPVAWKSKKPIDANDSRLPNSNQATQCQLPVVVATHLSYSNRRLQIIFSSKDIIFIIRNIYDVLVSQYFELVHRRAGKNTVDIWTYICEKKLLESYVTYLNSWAQNLSPEHHIVLTYEQLKHKTEQEFIRVIQFLNLKVVPDLVHQAIHISSFENMQQLQRQKRERRGIINDLNTNFSKLRIRRGKVGSYRDSLSDSEIQAIQNYCQSNLNSSAQALLSRNNLEF